jgi:quinoprotein glucose dehydrogenase
MHSENEGRRAEVAPRSCLAAARPHWTDGRDARILYVTLGYRLIALDAKTGAVVRTFGTTGSSISSWTTIRNADLVTGEIGLHATPVVARDVVNVGAAHRAGRRATQQTQREGLCPRPRLRTGTRLWIFHTIPRP